ncbi:MAG: hypothetical protein JXX14_09570 [Deltaproteobacteria bacterium]|nr:hypothetical protein [Deltaproteobacteria bacterium]
MPKTSRIKNVLIIAGAVVGALGVIVAVAVNFKKTLPLTETDYRVLTTARDLAPWLDGFTPQKKNESASKVRYLDRSVDLEYTYEDDEIYLCTMVSRETNAANALMTFNAQWAGSKLSINLNEDCHLSETGGGFSFGDSSHFATLVCNGEPGGIVFSTRVNNNVYMLTLGGVYFDNVADFQKFVGPALSHLSSWPQQ